MTLFGKILTGALVIVLVGGGVFFATRNSSENSDLTSTTTVEVTSVASTSTASGKKVPFAQFIATDKGSYKCDVNQSLNNVDTKGTVYVKDGMLKGEFTMTIAGREVTANMISRDGYTYSWSSLTPTAGYKVKSADGASGAVTGTTTATASGTYGFNAEQVGDYTCVATEADDSVFALPASVSFTVMN